MHSDRIDSYDATAVQVYFTVDDAERWVNVIATILADDKMPEEDEVLRSLLTRVGVIAEGERPGSLILSEREYAALDAAGHSSHDISDATEQIEKVENEGALLDAEQLHDHRATVNDSLLPR